jgi:hypothetical protein
LCAATESFAEGYLYKDDSLSIEQFEPAWSYAQIFNRNLFHNCSELQDGDFRSVVIECTASLDNESRWGFSGFDTPALPSGDCSKENRGGYGNFKLAEHLALSFHSG